MEGKLAVVESSTSVPMALPVCAGDARGCTQPQTGVAGGTQVCSQQVRSGHTWEDQPPGNMELSV